MPSLCRFAMEIERPYEAGDIPSHSENESYKAAKVLWGQSCVQCSHRKVKCDRNKPCTNCVKAKVECVVAAPQQTRKRRRQKLTERELVERLRRCELLLDRNGIQTERGRRVSDLEAKTGSSPGPGQRDRDQPALLDDESIGSGQNSHADHNGSRMVRGFQAVSQFPISS